MAIKMGFAGRIPRSVPGARDEAAVRATEVSFASDFGTLIATQPEIELLGRQPFVIKCILRRNQSVDSQSELALSPSL